MKRMMTVAPLAVLIILAVAAASYAQQTAKIAIIDSAKAFATSIEGKKAQNQMTERETKIKGDIQKMDDSIRLLENRLNTGRLTMTNEALMALQADIERERTKRKRYEEDQARDYQQLSANVLQKIQVEMVAIIEALAKERGLELVLDAQNSGVVTVSPTIDITDEVVRRYDQSKAAAAPVKK